jgi:hypothetical protein
MTRTTSKRFRVLRNIGMAAPYFPETERVLCFGSGDGFEIEIWRRLGFTAAGCEISKVKREIAMSHGLHTWGSLSQIKEEFNVYCAHTIEHVVDNKLLLRQLSEMCITTMCLIFPIEPNGSKNPSHLSPVKSLNEVKVNGFKTVLKYEHWNEEREGVIIYKRS